MRVLLFDGQGLALATPSTSVPPPRTPLASLFSSQANAAFAARLAALSSAARDALEIGCTRSVLARVHDGRILLPTTDAELLCHSFISIPSLYVAQVTRLLELLETGSLSDAPVIDVVGYSAGVLPALLVATSFPSPSMLSHTLSAPTQFTILRNALALFHVIASLGMEAQVEREDMLKARGIALDDPLRALGWSAVVFRETRDALEAKIRAWNAHTNENLLRIHLIAQTTATCHTITGFPSALHDFLASETFSSNPPIPLTSSSQNASPAPLSPPSSNVSMLSEPDATTLHSISRKSSVLSFYTTATSPFQSPSQTTTDLPAPIPIVPYHVNTLCTPNATPSPSPAQPASRPASKVLNIFGLFHVDVPPVRATRDRVLRDLFPCSEYDDALTPTDTPEKSAYLNRRLNELKLAHINEFDIALNALQLVPGYTLHDTYTGRNVSDELRGEQLIERVLEMIFLERIEFTSILESLSERIEREKEAEILNFGPGAGLARAAMRALKECAPDASLVLNDVSVFTAIPALPTSARGNLTTAKMDGQDPIAIVGMAVNFPGARNTDELWQVLEQSINTVEEIPQSRFSTSPYTGPNADPKRRMKTRFGNFLPDGMHASFDNTFFHISPREALAIDPQIRVLMRVGLQAIEASGLVVDEFCDNDAIENEVGEGHARSADVGCFVGMATSDYVLNLENEIGVHYATGNLPAFLAGRLAYALHLSGPSVVVNTACSSSGVAIHQACRALLSGDCKVALAGGVNMITSPDMYLGLDRAHFLSPSGNCKPWDASADGYCRSEGSGMFVLKRLSEALASSDNILGVIRGTEINQSSAAASITRPHGPTQAALFRTLLNKAGVRPEEVGVVEAHGTGTQAGDPKELKSLRSVLSPNGGHGRNANNTLMVTSIKANIGHAEAASGAASLAKVILMLRNQVVPPQIGLVSLNPKIERLENDFTQINTSGESIKWRPNSEGRRIALLSNFGAAGSNAALLIEEAPSCVSSFPVPEKESVDQVLVALSAETEAALYQLRDAYISSAVDSSLVDFAYTATARRRVRPWRLAVAANSVASMAKALTDTRPMRVSPLAQADEKKIVFVFSGQGGQHIGMGRQLYTISPSFRAFINSCDEKLINWGYPGVVAIINSEEKTSGLRTEDELVAFQCAIFVLECALANLWESWGITPDAVVGHSLGEYAALVTAGVLGLDSGLRLVARRARLMTQYCQQNVSGMLAVRLSSRDISEGIEKIGCLDLSVACYNGAKDSVVGGPIAQLSVLKEYLERSGAKCISVSVPFAYHTEAMDPILDELSAFARKFDFKAPQIQIVSNVTGKFVQPGDATVFNNAYPSMHCRQPVRFEEGINNLADELESIGAFIELGPHPTTLPMITHLTSKTGIASLQSLHKKTTARSALSSTLSSLFLFRSGIIWGKVYRELYPSARCIEIPGYPLVETEFWVPYVEDAPASQSITQPSSNPLSRYSFLGSWTQKPSSQDGNISEFETPIEQLAEYISGHKVASFSLCPASVYYELALSAATSTLEYREDTFADALTLSEVQFTHPLVYDPAVPLAIRTVVNVHPRGGKHAGTFTISSVVGNKERHVHCTGFFQRRQKGTLTSKLQLHAGNVERGKSSLLDPGNGIYHETLHTRTIYDLIFPRVVQYSKLYQVISTMTLDERKGEGFATIRLSPEESRKSFVAQPVFIDAMLHAAGFLINSKAGNGEAFICNKVDSSKMLFDIDYSATYEVYCSTNPINDSTILADAWAIQVGESRKVVAYTKRMSFSRLRINSLSKLLSKSIDVVERSASPAFIHRSFERCASPLAPVKLGSPFHPTHRANTPSSMSSATVVNSFDLPSEVTKLVGETCGVPLSDIHPNSNVADLGIDSLIWIEFMDRLKSIIPSASFDVSELMLSETVGDLINKVTKADQPFVFDPKSFAARTPLAKLAVRPVTPETPRVASPEQDDSTLPSQVKDIFSEVLGISVHDLRDGDSLDSLGLDSLGSIEALQELQQQFGVSLPQDFFREYSTIDSVQNYITNAVSPSRLARHPASPTLSNTEPIVKIIGLDRTLLQLQNSQNGASPLFLVHDGSGLSHCYSRIGSLGRSLWGISNPKLLSGESWKGGVSEMATHYIDQIKPIITGKGCVLGGWSFGGVVAFHMACDLMRAGIKVSGVVLIDSPSPYTTNPLPEELIDAVIRHGSHSSSSSEQQTKVIHLARTQMSHATRALVSYDPSCLTSSGSATVYPNVVMLRCSEAFPLSSVTGHKPPRRIPFLEDRSDPKASVRDWETLTGKDVPVFDIPGHHFDPFTPKNVNALTDQLAKAIAHLEAASERPPY
ncbi:hypothetical protein M0805_008042 [Coniferiporia weirii]|nr:hypothetical protein M0805_008042 [Coniferiporia weirii]